MPPGAHGQRSTHSYCDDGVLLLAFTVEQNSVCYLKKKKKRTLKDRTCCLRYAVSFKSKEFLAAEFANSCSTHTLICKGKFRICWFDAEPAKITLTAQHMVVASISAAEQTCRVYWNSCTFILFFSSHENIWTRHARKGHRNEASKEGRGTMPPPYAPVHFVSTCYHPQKFDPLLILCLPYATPFP